MRIAHVTTFEKGGAARSALRLHAALLKLGHDSRVLTLEKVSEDPTIRSLKPQYEQAATESSILFREFQSWYIQHNRTEVSNTFFSLNEPGLDISSAREIQEADMIHLHWVSGFLSPGSIARLQKLGKPIFWTLHDQRPFTGGCHFSAGCLKFQADCHGCPQLDYDPYLLTKAQLRDAADQLHYGGIQFCSPSQWLADYAESSALLAKQKVKVIPYGIDADIFKPSEKTSARAALDLPREGIFLLFSADNANEKRKGFPLLMAALRECQANSEIKKLIVENKLGLICLGHPSEQLRQLGIPVHALGYIHSDEKVGQAYNAADLFVLPSLEDNLPNTVMEAMSCGVPVAAFAAGGIPEMVSHGKNGLLIEPGNVTGLAANLIQLISNPAERETFGKTAREEVLARFPLSRQGEAYLELYRAVAAKMNDDSPATEETMTMAPAGPEVSRIVAASAPRPLQSHLYSKTNAFAQLQKERDAHVGTLHQQLEYLSRLKKENDELRQQLEEKHEEVNRQQKMLKKLPVKILRALKIV